MADERSMTSCTMASTFTVPLISTVESSQHLRNHSGSQSLPRRNRPSTRPFILPRIPSERFELRAMNCGGGSSDHESGQKCGGNGIMNRVSFADNGSMSAPSHQTNGQLTRISKGAEAAAQDRQPGLTCLPHTYKLPRVESKSQTSAGNMELKSR